MCIIVSKEKGLNMPSENILKNCFDRNKDGAGYMIARNGFVEIKKGFMTFNDFMKSLNSEGDLTDYSVVLHFRITTQGGVKKHLCHPYPLKHNLAELKQLNCKCEIGVAHNGIIDLTSEYSGYGVKKKEPDYNDTMKFITDYLSLIIKDKNFYLDGDTLELIERLCGSKLAILDNQGHITYIGQFIRADGIMYSNSTYETPKVSASFNSASWYYNDFPYDYDYYYDIFDNECYDLKKHKFSFEDVGVCPYDLGDTSYCQDCDGKLCGMCDELRQVFKDEYDKPKYVTFNSKPVEIDWVTYDERYNCAFGYDEACNTYEIEFNSTDYEEYTISLIR